MTILSRISTPVLWMPLKAQHDAVVASPAVQTCPDRDPVDAERAEAFDREDAAASYKISPLPPGIGASIQSQAAFVVLCSSLWDCI